MQTKKLDNPDLGTVAGVSRSKNEKIMAFGLVIEIHEGPDTCRDWPRRGCRKFSRKIYATWLHGKRRWQSGNAADHCAPAD